MSKLRLGLWGARADRSGLAIQGHELARHMKPVKVMGFDASSGPGQPNLDRPSDWSLYDGPWELETDDDFWSVSDDRVRAWLEGLDVVWGVETFYHDQFNAIAHEMGVATVQHCNPEFYRFDREGLPKPTITCVPTTWRLEHMPGVEVLPTPVATDRLVWKERPLYADDRLRFLHVIGRQAAEDRNGTRVLFEALSYVRVPMVINIASQGPQVAGLPTPSSTLRIVVVEAVDEYSELYAPCDVLVMPRRYGGQCLPVQEARACGLAVVMTDCAPQDGWLPLDCRISAKTTRSFPTQGGEIDIYDSGPRELADTMDYLSLNRERVKRVSYDNRAWAKRMSWDVWKPSYERVIERAYELQRSR